MIPPYPHDTLGQIFSPDLIFLQRISFEPYGFLPGAEGEFDRKHCATMPLFDKQKVIVPEGVLHPVSINLLEHSGITPLPESQCLVYRDQVSFESILSNVPKGSLLVDHPHPVERLEPEKYRVPRDLLVKLVDKRFLSNWAPTHHLPPRVTVSLREKNYTSPALWERGLGCFLKPAGPYPAGGGFGIRLVRTPEEVEAAYNIFADSEPPILEAILPHRISYCVNLAFPENNPTAYFLLGVAEQSIHNGMMFRGSWLHPPHSVPESLYSVANEVAQKIHAAGYIGVAGVDIIDTEEGWKVVDLNPRTNFSTAPLLHARRIRRELGQELIFQAMTIQVKKINEEMALDYLQDTISSKRLVVIRAYHDGPDGENAMSLGVMLQVDTLQESEHMLTEMKQNGLELPL